MGDGSKHNAVFPAPLAMCNHLSDYTEGNGKYQMDDSGFCNSGSAWRCGLHGILHDSPVIFHVTIPSLPPAKRPASKRFHTLLPEGICTDYCISAVWCYNGADGIAGQSMETITNKVSGQSG